MKPFFFALFSNFLFLLVLLSTLSVNVVSAQQYSQMELDSLENELNRLGKDTTRLNLLYELCTAFTFQDREKSIAYAEQCMGLAEDIGEKETRAKCAMRRIYILNPPDLDVPVKELNQICKNTQDSLLIINGHIYAGIAYWHHPKKFYDKAITQFLEALGYCKGKNNRSESICYINLYKIYGELKEYEKAIVFLEKGIALAEQNNDFRLMADSYSSLSELQKLLGESEKANEAALKALNAGEGKVDDVDMVEVYINAGDALLSPFSAEKYLKKGLDLAKKYQHTELTMKGYRQLSKFYLNHGKIEEAEKLTQESISLAEKHNEAFHLRFTYYEASKVAEKKKDYKSALAYYKKYNTWGDSVFIASKNKEIAEAEIKFETEKKELENSRLKEKTTILNAQNKTYTVFAVGGFLLAASALFFFFRTRGQKQVIELQNKKLEDLNATKDRFFAIIAHDLRAPVIDFKGITKTIGFLAENNEIDRIKQIGKHVDKAANNLSNLLDNLLSWALLQKGSIPYHPETIEAKEISEEVVDLYRNIALEKDIIIENYIPENMKINADRDSIFTIFSNLLNNAIKFTGRGGMVSFSAKTEVGKIYFEVKDTGAGIPAHHLETIFKLNENKRSRGTEGEAGTGLGLILVKELVDLNKGEIGVSSGLGKGSSFVVALPKS